MSVITWDSLVDRRYEAGVERGVLYPIEGDAVSWSGLVSVSETKTREVKSYYLDGMKYLDHIIPGFFSAKVQAITYPDVLDRITGVDEFAPGVNVHDQKAGMFHLAYRTLIGNPVDGLDYGYKLHLAYNLSAIPSDSTFSTLNDTPNPNVFEWLVTSIQTSMWGIRPASHLSFDSRHVSPDILQLVEDQLYGTAETDPVMPDLVTLLTTIEGMSP